MIVPKWLYSLQRMADAFSDQSGPGFWNNYFANGWWVLSVSSRSEQKYSQETGLTASDTLSTDSPEEDNSDKTSESQHSEIDETFETHQYNTPNEESKPKDIQRRIKIRCDKVQSKILFIKEDALHSRKETTSSENVYLTNIATNILLSLRPMTW